MSNKKQISSNMDSHQVLLTVREQYGGLQEIPDTALEEVCLLGIGMCEDDVARVCGKSVLVIKDSKKKWGEVICAMRYDAIVKAGLRLYVSAKTRDLATGRMLVSALEGKGADTSSWIKCVQDVGAILKTDSEELGQLLGKRGTDTPFQRSIGRQ